MTIRHSVENQRSSVWNAALGLLFSCVILLQVSFGTESNPTSSAETIDDLVEATLRNNAELRSFGAEVDIAKGRRRQAGLWKNPEVSGDYGERRVKNGESAIQGEGTTRSLSIVQTFEFPGKGSLRKAIANQDVHLAELGLEQFRLALAGQVRILALQHQVAVLNAAAAEEITERSSELILLLAQRATGGSQPFLERRVIEGGLVEILAQAREFIQEREESRLELNRLMGRPANQTLNLKVTVENAPGLPAADQLVQFGLARNFQLRAHAIELEKAVNELSASKLESAPDFSVGPFYSLDHAGEREENMGFTFMVRLPLWDWNQGNIDAARARSSQADARLQDARHKVETEIARRFRSFELFRNQLEKIPGDLIANLRDAADLADRQYRLGAIHIQLYLETQRQFLIAQRAYNDALLGMWRDYLDLQLLTGSTDTIHGDFKATEKK